MFNNNKKQEIKGDGNSQLNADVINYYQAGQQEVVDQGIIDEIFLYVKENIKNKEDINRSLPDKIIQARKKIEINFPAENEQEYIQTLYKCALEKTALIERKFGLLDSDDQEDIHSFIFAKYHENKQNKLSNIENINSLFTHFTPSGKEKNPLYNNCSKAFVLFFFGDCTIFEKTKEEKSKNQQIPMDI